MAAESDRSRWNLADVTDQRGYIYIYEIADSVNSRVKKIQTLDYNTINKNNIINKTLDAATYHIGLNDNNR